MCNLQTKTTLFKYCESCKETHTHMCTHACVRGFQSGSCFVTVNPNRFGPNFKDLVFQPTSSKPVFTHTHKKPFNSCLVVPVLYFWLPFLSQLTVVLPDGLGGFCYMIILFKLSYFPVLEWLFDITCKFSTFSLSCVLDQKPRFQMKQRAASLFLVWCSDVTDTLRAVNVCVSVQTCECVSLLACM